MTVNTTGARSTYTGNGSTTVFAFPYYFFNNTDLVVILRDSTTLTAITETVQVLNTHYTVSGAGVNTGGSITMVTAPTATQELTIYRQTIQTQETTYDINEPFPVETLGDALDQLTLEAQDNKDQVSRTVRLSEGFTPTFDPVLPVDIDQAGGKLPVINPGGTGWDTVDNWPLLTDLDTQAQAAAASAAAAAASQSAANGSATAAATSATNAATSAADAAASAAAAASATTIITTKGDVIVGDTGGAAVRLGVGADGDVLTADSAQPDGVKWAPAAGSGTVTSVDLTMPAEFAVSGNPVTGAGTLAVTKATQSANQVFAGPTTGAAAAPTFRAIVDADLPANAVSPLTTKGDVHTFDTADARLGVGSDGDVLTADSTKTTGLKWAPAGTTSPLTTKGDIYTFDTANARLPVGSDGQVLTADSAQTPGVKWGPATPLTTKGDILSFTTVAARVAVGTNGQVLTADSAQAAGVKWGAASPLTTKGDLYAFDTAGNRLPAGSDGQILSSDSTQTTGLKWITNTSGSSGGGLNKYLSNPDFETGSTSGWSLFNTTLTSGVPTGSITAGATSIDTFTTTTTNPLQKTTSLSIAASSAFAAGDGFISDVFDIDNEDSAQILASKFFYGVVSGAANLDFSGTSSNTWQIYWYDVTNSKWVQPAGVYNLVGNGSKGNPPSTGTVQLDSTCTQARLAVICINNSAGAASMLFDDFSVGPQVTSIGPAMSDSKSYNLVIGATTTAPTLGTTSINNAQWSQVGEKMEITYTVQQTAAGTAGSGTYLFPIPSGYSIDTTKTNANTGGFEGICGAFTGSWAASGTTYTAHGDVVVYDSTHLAIQLEAQFTAAGAVNNANGFLQSASGAIGSGTTSSTMSFTARIPIAGWSSNTVQSADTDTRLCAVKYRVSGSQSPSSGANINFATQVYDTHAAVTTGSSWKFVAPETSYYKISGALGVTAGAPTNLILYVNGSPSDGLVTLSAINTIYSFATEVKLNANDTINLAIDSAGVTIGSNASNNFICIERLSGPAVVSASDSVNMRYHGTSTSLSASTATPISFTSKDFDNTNSYSGSTFTCPLSGKYQVNGSFETGAISLSTSQTIQMYFYKTGVSTGNANITYGNGTTQFWNVNGSDLIQCNAGDTIQLYGYSSTATTLVGGSFSVARVGN